MKYTTIWPRQFSKNGWRALTRNQGFTLLEILIALTVFTFFYVAYVSSSGQNKATSTMMREEIKLKSLCQNVLNSEIIDLPKLSQALVLAPNTRDFEEEGLENYSYTIEYQNLIVPNLGQILGEEDQNEEQSSSQFGLIFNEIKKFTEKKIWQLRVTVTDKTNNFSFSLSTWVSNPEVEAKIEL